MSSLHSHISHHISPVSLLVFGFFVLGAFFFSTTTHAQVSLSGTLYTDAGATTAEAGISIRAGVGTSTPSVHSVSTDASGNFTISDIATSTIGAWATTTPLASDNEGQWEEIVYANGLFVAVGSSSASGAPVMTSADGINWATSSAAGNDDDWYAVTYANGLFVAVGDTNSGTNGAVMTSPDGINWTARSAAGDDDEWEGVTFGNGLFVAVADTNGGTTDAVMTSPDGINWTVRSAAGDDDAWRDVVFYEGLFVAVGTAGNRVMTSPDGINWTTRSAAGNNDNWYSVAYGNDTFVAVGNFGDLVMTSPDGINWTAQPGAAGGNDWWQGVTYANGLFIAVGNRNADRIMTSPDGITWTVEDAVGNDDDWTDVAYGQGRFVVVGRYDSPKEKVASAPAGFGENTPITLWVDDSATTSASTLTYGINNQSGTSTITGIDLYADTLILNNATGTQSVNLADADFYDYEDDADILFTATTSTTTITADFIIATGTTLFASQNLVVQGDFTQDGEWRAEAGVVQFLGDNQTVSGLLTEQNQFANVVWGGDGVKELQSPASTSDFTILGEGLGGPNEIAKVGESIVLPGSGRAAAWSNDYLAVSHFGGNYLSFYQRSGDTLTKLADPDALDSEAQFLDWSGDYLAAATWGGNNLAFYKRSGDVLTRLANPTALPSLGNGVSWSGDYLAVAHYGGNFLSFYKRSGDTLTKLADPTNPGGTGESVAWSGDYLAVGSRAGEYFSFYKRSGDTLVKLATPEVPASGQSIVYAMDWNGDYLAAGHSNGTYLSLYQRSGDTLVKLSAPTGSLPGPVLSAKWVGNYLVVGYQDYYAGKGIALYRLDGEQLVQLPDSELLGGTVNEVAVSGGYIAALPSSASFVLLKRPIASEVNMVATSTISGSYHNSGKLTVNDRALFFDGDETQELTGDMTGDSAFFDVVLSGAGEKVFIDSVRLRNLMATGTTAVSLYGTTTVSQNLTLQTGALVNDGTIVLESGESQNITTDSARLSTLGSIKLRGGGIKAVQSPADIQDYTISDEYVELLDSGELLAGDGAAAAWNNDYLAVGLVNNNDNLRFYKREGDSLTQLANPTQPATGTNRRTWALAWSGDYLAAGTIFDNGLYLYRRDGDVLTKLSNPSSPGGGGRSVDWSGDYLAVGHSSGNLLSFYSRSGDTLTKLTNPTKPSGTVVNDVAWSGDYLAAGTNSFSDGLRLYVRSGNSLSPLGISEQPTGQVSSLSWNGNYLLVGHSGYISLYELDGDVLTSVDSLNTVYTPVTFSWKDTYLAAGYGSGQPIMLYRLDGDTLVPLEVPPETLSTGVADLDWSGDYLAVARILNGEGIGLSLHRHQIPSGLLTNESTIAGDYYNDGVFLPDGGSTVFTGENNTITGSLLDWKSPAPQSGTARIEGAYEIIGNATTSNLVIESGGSLTAPATALTISGDFTQNGSFDNNGGTINLSSVSDIRTTIQSVRDYDTVEGQSAGIWMSLDGTVFFQTGFSGDRVYQYSLSTPYDISTLSLVASTSVNAIEATPTGVTLKPDGTRLYLTGFGGDKVYEYSMSPAFDVTTMSLVASTSVSNPFDLTFDATGERLYVILSGGELQEYSLSSAYDITTVSLVATSTVASYSSNPSGITLSQDGQKILLTDANEVSIVILTLSEAFDSTSVVSVATTSVAQEDTDPRSLTLADNDIRLYMTGRDSNHIYEYGFTAYYSGDFIGSNSFNNVVFGAQSAQLLDVASTTDILVATSATMQFGDKLTVGGNYSVYGTANAATNTTYFTGVDKIVSGNLLGENKFRDMYVIGSYAIEDDIQTQDFTISAGGLVVASGTNITVVGDFSQQGDLESSGSTFSFYGAGSNVSGSLNGSSSFSNMVFQPELNWVERTVSAGVLDVEYLNNQFVAVGQGSVVLTSPDGLSWTQQTATAGFSNWYDVTYGNGLYVSVANSGDKVMSSPDAETWTARTSVGTNPRWQAVEYGNEIFVALGEAIGTTNILMTSTNGTSWTLRSAAGNDDYWSDVIYREGLFVAVGSGGSGRNAVMTSPDGIAWTIQSAGAGDDDGWRSIAYGNGLFVAVSSFGDDRVMTSPDGVTWTVQTVPDVRDAWIDVTYGNGMFVAVGLCGYGTSCFMTSPDGVNWTSQPGVGGEDFWYGAAYGNNTFVALNLSGGVALSAATVDSYIRVLSNASTSDLSIHQGNLILEENISVSRDFTNAGTLVPNESTIVLTGTNQTITGPLNGTTTFHAFNKTVTEADTLTFGASSTYEFTGELTLLGSTTASSSDSLTLVSSDPGTEWYIDPQAQRNIEAVAVSDSYNFNQTNIVCYPDCTDDGNNTNWFFSAGAEIFFSSEYDQQFYPGQSTATLSDLVIIEGMDGAGITSANDIRITIATTTTDFRFDTTQTTVTVFGPARDKVSQSVTYEDGGATLVLDVTSDFEANDILQIRDVQVGGFGSVSTSASNLALHIDGDTLGAPHTYDSYSMAITGAIFFNNHSNGQVSNQYSVQNLTDTTFYAFSVATTTENVTVDTIEIRVTGATGITPANLTNLRLYRDINGDGDLDGGDVSLSGAGVFVKNGLSGYIRFTNPFLASAGDYIVVADASNVPTGARIVFSLHGGDVETTGLESLQSTLVVSEVDTVTFARLSRGGGGSRIGNEPTNSDPAVSGGGGGAGEEINLSSDDVLVLEPGEFAPTATGDIDNSWTNPANGYLSDDTRTESAGNGNQQSFDTFNITLPGGDSIIGVIVRLEAAASTASGTIAVALSWDGGTTFTTTKATPVLSTSDTVYTLGASNDTWGHTWSVAEFDNTNFRLRVIANTDSNTVYVDAIAVEPVHQATGGGGGGGGPIGAPPPAL